MRRLPVALALGAVVLVSGGCALVGLGDSDTYVIGGPVSTGRPLEATSSLIGPDADPVLVRDWSPVPTTPDATFARGAGPQGCLTYEPEEVAAIDGATVLQDQRGSDAAAFLWAGSGFATCAYGYRTGQGTASVLYSTRSPAAEPGSLVVWEELDESPSMIFGAVDPGAADVEVVTRSGLEMSATLGGGHFLAWWPSTDPAVTVRSLDADGKVIKEVHRDDMTGWPS